MIEILQIILFDQVVGYQQEISSAFIIHLIKAISAIYKIPYSPNEKSGFGTRFVHSSHSDCHALYLGICHYNDVNKKYCDFKAYNLRHQGTL